MSLPLVVIVGRQNVGKSYLFNKISTTKSSLVHDYCGVTRDIIVDVAEWRDIAFKIVDTAGIAFHNNDLILKKSMDQTFMSCKLASTILFVIDGAVGMTNEDLQILSIMNKTKIPIIAVANKSDLFSFDESFQSLKNYGFEKLIPISAAHNKGIEDVFDAVEEVFIRNNVMQQASMDEEKKNISFAFIGRPNVGKSSLLNIVTDKDRAIVSDVAGTTRETVTETINLETININISDTAGVRRKRSVDSRLEELMISNTMNAIKDNDISVIVLDASVESLLDQDLVLISYAYNTLYRGILIVWNKIDLIPNGKYKEHIAKLILHQEHIFARLPMIYVSAKTGENIKKIVPEILALYKRYHTYFDGFTVGSLIKGTIKKRPLMRNKMAILVKRCEIIRTAPPTFVIYTNLPEYFEDSQKRFLSNLLYKNYNLRGVPLKWIIRKY